MNTITQITNRDLEDAACLVTMLRTDMNNRVVCTDEDMLAVLVRALEEPTYTGFIARNSAGKGIGYLGLNSRFAIYASGKFLQITELFVKPEERRQGIARALITAAENEAKAQGVNAIELGAPRQETHPQTHAFYKSLGYQIVGPRLSKTLPS